jgi:hypothetical protein
MASNQPHRTRDGALINKCLHSLSDSRQALRIHPSFSGIGMISGSAEPQDHQ